MLAPGVTFETVDLNRPRVSALRTDICGFAGFAERGPLDRAVKLRSWRQFLDAFGPPLEYAYTGEAVRLFFENGGDTAFMARVADPADAATARVTLPGGLTLSAAYAAIGRGQSDNSGPLTTPSRLVSDSPGAWGNRLSVTVFAGGRGVTESLPNQPADGATMRAAALPGFETGSWVRLIQDGMDAPAYAHVAAIDRALLEITWQSPVTGLDFARPVRLETVEFTLSLALDGQEVSRHADLSLDPRSTRYVGRLLQEQCAMLAARVATTFVPGPPGQPPVEVALADLSDPANWPAPGLPLAFSGGRDGLRSLTRTQFSDALTRLAEVDEISVLAAPDIVLRAEAEAAPLAPILRPNACTSPEPLPEGILSGIVRDADTDAPVGGARVTSLDVEGRVAMTAGDGSFTLTGLPLGQVDIRIAKVGYTTLDASTQTFSVVLTTPQEFHIAERTLPPALHIDDIYALQMEMAGQGESGLYRVALLDVPQEMLRLDDVQSWRARFDTAHAALYWPWLVLAEPGQEARSLPPSGAIAGLIARIDLSEGPQRAPANQRLRDVAALTDAADDAVHGLLNTLGVNVIRATPGRGIAPQGARTLSSDPEWRFLNVRRLMLMIAEAIQDGHQWAVFEPNSQVLRDAIRHSVSAFLSALWRRGALAGASPAAAFAVKCDAENNPPAVTEAGQLVAEIAVAPVRPYEFIRLRLGRTDRLSVQIEE
ncbi:Phage tail sheath protein FI [Rhodovulum sp. P5]|uniref:phage tail sheath C-terminal domain-containing protein n=1 Tax=Rhodovulum sp. P5 TaxID=1564506 RepID=UPI0009C39BF2|nr:phage tail sheath C-terminal domain-containing protein [Rhodovulum sp. P5]ARE41830.1 Phage tail sheath protein FI [Rhodovulum sp. P5]